MLQDPAPVSANLVLLPLMMGISVLGRKVGRERAAGVQDLAGDLLSQKGPQRIGLSAMLMPRFVVPHQLLKPPRRYT